MAPNAFSKIDLFSRFDHGRVGFRRSGPFDKPRREPFGGGHIAGGGEYRRARGDS